MAGAFSFMNIYPKLLPDEALPIRVLTACLLIYILIIVVTRFAGKRSVSKMNSFDWIVTVAVGSIVAAAVVAPDDFGPAIIAATALIVFQWLLTYISTHSKMFRKTLKNNPTLLVRCGELVEDGMQKTHVGEGEILAAARGAGIADIKEVRAMVLETDGSFSVIPMSADDPAGFEDSTLKNLSEVDSLDD